MSEQVKCWKCGEVYDSDNRLMVIRHTQDFCRQNRRRKPYKRVDSRPKLPVGERTPTK